ncbi:MAG: C-GCAxxG-C-C family protein [Eubacteriales bacterium]|nr:C-GCAxxG-C-C family protein [Eubacteriales bacterium]
MTKGELAQAYFLEGYNCSQSVFLAFHEELGLDLSTAAKLSSSFGGGMGRMREVCGAVSAMFMVAGLKYGYDDPKDYEAKKEHYARIRALAEEFKKKNSSIVCKELLGITKPNGDAPPEKRTEEYYKKRPCPHLVKDAADIVEEFLL